MQPSGGLSLKAMLLVIISLVLVLASATYLGHEVDMAHGISGATEFMASSSSYSQYGPDYSISSSQSSAHMKIDENVTDGRVHIGILQGSRKNPSVEVDEDYIGTYHIYKNISLSSDSVQRNTSESWLDCCTGSYFDIFRRHIPAIDADKVFSYKSIS